MAGDKKVFTLVDSESEQEAGEIVTTAIPFYKSHKSSCLSGGRLVGENRSPTILNYPAGNSRFKKELKKEYQTVKQGDRVAEESREFFMTNKFLEQGSCKASYEMVKNEELPGVETKRRQGPGGAVAVEFIRETAAKSSYQELAKELRETPKINENIFSKAGSQYSFRNTILITDRMIETYSKCSSAWVTYENHVSKNRACKVFGKTFYNQIEFDEFYRELSYSLWQAEEGRSCTIREYSLKYRDDECTLLIYSYGSGDGHLFGNGLDVAANRILVEKEGGVVELEHPMRLFQTNLFNNVLEVEHKNAVRYALNGGRILAVGNIGEIVEYKEVSYDLFTKR
ncbi:hypothetical protein ECANGB1_1316 [Enterospora canceri]|uniref:Uncharacterized protein n=1 Tax=Enterospora canceri TaxID=1081671 RepID=A0A1Y1S686_9MICR|nr:hypothetical protein ECANGB1_1316 [Enterospora canceri]